MTTTENVFEKNTKQLIVEVEGQSTSIELGGTSWEKRKSNDISDFARPNTGSGSERRAQNLNQIQENHIFNALLSDQFVKAANYEGLSNTDTKEDIEDALDEIFELNQRIRIQYGHVDVKGYLTEYNVDENSQNDNSTFAIDFNLLVAEPMSGA